MLNDSNHMDAGTDVQMQVTDLQCLAPDIFELTLNRGEGFPFQAGECVVLFAEDGTSRPYSIASSPEEAELRILFRRMTDGVMTRWLCNRSPGDPVRVSYPFGDFRPAPAADSVFIATGVGIAPFLSCLHGDLAEAQRPVCFYGVRREGEAVHRALLERATQLTLAVSRETASGCFAGRVDALLQSQDDLLPGRRFFLCGVDAMVYEVADWLEAQGVPSDSVHTEIFFTTGA